MDSARRNPVWDCGSTLYDSHELKSFMQQLDSALAVTRCSSMPHLPQPSNSTKSTIAATAAAAAASAAAATTRPQTATARRKQSGLSRSIQKLLRSVLRLSTPLFRAQLRSHGHHDRGDRYSGGTCSLSARLESIPEACEKDILASPESDAAVVRKTVSERFTGRSAAAATAAAVSGVSIWSASAST